MHSAGTCSSIVSLVDVSAQMHLCLPKVELETQLPCTLFHFPEINKDLIQAASQSAIIQVEQVQFTAELLHHVVGGQACRRAGGQEGRPGVLPRRTG